MTIIEQILAGLQTKFTGVDAAILTRIATKKAEGVTDASQVPTIVEGVGFTDVLTNYGDFRAGDASFKSVQNYEKKHNLKDGKPIENPNPETKTEEKKDDVPSWAQTLIDSNKTLSEKLASYEQKDTQAQRSAQILAKAKEYGIPESQAKRYSIPDDADLDAYFKDVKQELTNAGFEGVKAPESAEQKMEKETDAIAKMISDGTKEIVEQNKN